MCKFNGRKSKQRTKEMKKVNMSNNQTVDVGDHTKHLGTILQSDGKNHNAVNDRLEQAKAAHRALKQVWRTNKLTVKQKVLFYKTIITTILLYSLDCRTLTAGELDRLEKFPNKCLRHISHMPVHITRIHTAELRERRDAHTVESMLTLKRLNLWKNSLTTDTELNNFHEAFLGRLPWDQQLPDVTTSKRIQQLRHDITALTEANGMTDDWGKSIHEGPLQFLRRQHPDILCKVFSFVSITDEKNKPLIGPLCRPTINCAESAAAGTVYVCRNENELRMHRVSQHLYRCKCRSCVVKPQCPKCNRKFETVKGLKPAKKHFQDICAKLLTDDQLDVYREAATGYVDQQENKSSHSSSTVPTARLARAARPQEHIDTLFRLQAADQAAGNYQ